MAKTVELDTQLNLPVSNTSNVYVASENLLSEETASICQLILFGVVCQGIDVFGIGTNIINIMCFVKQGFKDPVNVSLFGSLMFLGLALADLGCLVTLVFSNVCYTAAFSASDLPFDPIEFQYLTSAMLHTTFVRISACMTAIITVERCICIIAPLKVKGIVTSRRVAILVTCLFILLLTSVAPVYVVNQLGMKYYPHRNKTLLGLVYTSDREEVEMISFAINNMCIPFSTFFVVTLCTIMLVNKLHKISKWRKSSAASVQTDNVSNRNRKVAKMVVMISTLFIICFIPISLVFVAYVLVPGLAVDGKYRNVAILCVGACFVLESINSSANIFIYYYMSSKYRDVFQKMISFNSRHLSAFDN